MKVAIEDTFSFCRMPLHCFGSARVIVYLTFTFDTERKLRKDIDNLIKFTLDALVVANIIDDDMEVMEVRGKKALGEEDTTEIRIHRWELNVD